MRPLRFLVNCRQLLCAEEVAQSCKNVYAQFCAIFLRYKFWYSAGMKQSLENTYDTSVDVICPVGMALFRLEYLSLMTTTYWFPFPVLDG